MRTTTKNTTKKYLYFLNSLKERMDNKEITETQTLPSLYNISYNWLHFLIKNKIIEKKEGFYHWNEKIPVSIKIINQYRKSINKIYYKSKEKSVSKQTTIVFDKKKIKENLDKFSHIKTEQKVGVIRKFLKWLW